MSRLDCPDQMTARDPQKVMEIIDDINKRKHVGIFREIIPARILEPNKGDFRYHSELIQYLKPYMYVNE